MSKKSITIAAVVGIGAALALAIPAVAAPSYSYTVCRTVEPEHTVVGTYRTFRVRTDDCVTRYLGGALPARPTETLRQVVVSSTPK